MLPLATLPFSYLLVLLMHVHNVHCTVHEQWQECFPLNMWYSWSLRHSVVICNQIWYAAFIRYECIPNNFTLFTNYQKKVTEIPFLTTSSLCITCSLSWAMQMLLTIKLNQKFITFNLLKQSTEIPVLNNCFCTLTSHYQPTKTYNVLISMC